MRRIGAGLAQQRVQPVLRRGESGRHADAKAPEPRRTNRDQQGRRGFHSQGEIAQSFANEILPWQVGRWHKAIIAVTLLGCAEAGMPTIFRLKAEATRPTIFRL